MSVVEPKRAVKPSTWRTGDLVIVKLGNGAERPGLILEGTRHCDIYEKPSWMYRVLVGGVVTVVFESKSNRNSIVRGAAPQDGHD